MKQLDWKSFAIGILLTTTVVFGVAAINPTDEKQWDENQKWLVKHFALGTYATKKSITERRSELTGWEFVGVFNNRFTYRKPVEQWPALPDYGWDKLLDQKANLYEREKDLLNIYP